MNPQQGPPLPPRQNGPPPTALLHQAIQALTTYVQVEPDVADRRVVSSMIPTLQQLTLKDTAEQRTQGAPSQGPPPPNELAALLSSRLAR